MKIPKVVKIGGHSYQVIVRDRDRKDGQTALGSHNARITTIWIDNQLSKSQQESTFLHEIIEAINYANLLGLNESQISSFEHNLYQVLKDNNLLK